MREIISSNWLSLDGFIAGPGGALDQYWVTASSRSMRLTYKWCFSPDPFRQRKTGPVGGLPDTAVTILA
jgi:hypothetical protein